MLLRRPALEALVAHAREALPNECCGLLIGSAGCIEEAARARNVRESASRYRIDPADHFTVIRRVRREGRTIVGAYHSHPAAAAVPSATDIAEAYDRELLHVIVSMEDPEHPHVRGYRIADGHAHEVQLVPVP